jgi:hypothetical protein
MDFDSLSDGPVSAMLPTGIGVAVFALTASTLNGIF